MFIVFNDSNLEFLKGIIMKFVCPKCKGELTVGDTGTAGCGKGHAYDRARSGYYNLLLSLGGAHGDNREMVEARRAFLDTGAYLPLAECVSGLVKKYVCGCGCDVLDIGCGEGYYTDIIERAVNTSDIKVCFSGIDISKDAVVRAAKRNKNLSLAVASAYHIPASDGAFDMTLNMFSPLALEETRRVLRSGGIFIMAVPGREHLFGLKSFVYEKPYKNNLSDSHIDGFTLEETQSVSYEINLTKREDISSLFMMTPYAYRTKPQDKARILSLDKLTTSVDFVVFVYRKN